MIKYTAKQLTKLKEAGFYPDTMLTSIFVLESLATDDIELLDVLDDNTTSKRMLLVYFDLVRNGFIEETEKDSLSAYKLTEKGIAFLNELNGVYNPKPQENKNVEDWFDEWMDLWPKGVSTGGKLVRSDRKACLEKMKKFLKSYDYDRFIIMEATRRYVDSFESSGFQFIKSATYFIDKRGEGSEMAAQCQKILDTETSTEYPIHGTFNGLI